MDNPQTRKAANDGAPPKGKDKRAALKKSAAPKPDAKKKAKDE